MLHRPPSNYQSSQNKYEQGKTFHAKEKDKFISFDPAGPREKIYFDPSKLKCAIVTCGGLCPGLNDIIRGVAGTVGGSEFGIAKQVVLHPVRVLKNGTGTDSQVIAGVDFVALAGFAAILEFLDLEHRPGPANFFTKRRINSSWKLDPTRPDDDDWDGWDRDRRARFGDLAGMEEDTEETF